MTTYAQDRDGKYIPASQRPDGTWRKARRVKDGYVPQEEVPLYESKGKLFMKKPDLPIGMCPVIAQQAKERRDKQQQKKQQQQQKQNPFPGLFVLPNSSNSNDTNQKKKQNSKTANGLSNSALKTISKKTSSSSTNSKIATNFNDVSTVNEIELSEAVKNLDLEPGCSTSGEDDLAKKLKKLRKKLREIETIEAKIDCGELKKPDPDQVEKIGRKNQILSQLKELEKLETK